MKKTICGIFVLLMITVSLLAMGGKEEANRDGLKVIATTTIIGDVTSHVLGDKGELTVLMPVGQNPHAYTPTPRDIASMESADIIFINGLDLEEGLLPIIESLNGPIVVEVSHELDSDHDEVENHDDHNHHAGNPHFWFSPVRVMHWVHEIVETLEEADPENAASYQENGEAYESMLEALDAEMRELIETVPVGTRKLVMDHSSFEYFAEDYGFTILAKLIPGMNDQAEPSPRHIADVVEIVKENDIKALFVGGTAPQNVVKMAEAVSDEINRPLPVVELLTGSLTASGRGTDYIDFTRYNTEKIVEALSQE